MRKRKPSTRLSAQRIFPVLLCLFVTITVSFAATEQRHDEPDAEKIAAKIKSLIERLDADRLAERNAAEAELVALPESEAALLPEESSVDFDSGLSPEVVARLKNVFQKRLRETARRATGAFAFRLLESPEPRTMGERFWITIRTTWDKSVIPVCLEFPMDTFSATFGPEKSETENNATEKTAGKNNRTFYPTTRETTLEISPTGEQFSGDLPFSLEGNSSGDFETQTQSDSKPDSEPDAEPVFTVHGTCRILLAMRPKDFVFRRPLQRRGSRAAPSSRTASSPSISPIPSVAATGSRTGRSLRQGNAMVALESVRLAPPEPGATTQNLVIRVALDYDRAHGALQSHRTWVYDAQAVLFAADGRRITPFTYTPTRYVPNGISIAFSFRIPTDVEIEEFVYTVPTMIVSKSVPINVLAEDL